MLRQLRWERIQRRVTAHVHVPHRRRATHRRAMIHHRATIRRSVPNGRRWGLNDRRRSSGPSVRHHNPGLSVRRYNPGLSVRHKHLHRKSAG
jgi:hypothetical protein